MMRRLTSRALAAPAVATALRAQALKVPPRMPLHKHDNFLSGTNADYLDSLYDMWEANPASVHESVAELFRNANARQSGEVPIYTETRRLVDEESLNRPVKVGIQQTVQESRQLISLIQAHERHGHLFARLDPLQYERGSKRVPSQKHAMRMNLHPTAFGFTEADFDRTFCVGFHDGVGGLFDANTGPMSLRQMYDRVKRAYTGTIGYEFMHIYDEKVLHWLRERIECPSRVDNNPLATELSSEDRKSLYGTLASAVEFELFLKTKFQTTKRFGSDGAESFLVGMDSLIERATSHGVEEVVLGMAHRGRLSVLHHVCGKPLEALLREFKGIQPQDVPWAEDYGDVKYHRGFRSERKLRNGKVCAVELLNNPSHLETVNPVVQGYSRAAQVERDDGYGHRVLPVEIHGDAAFAGQGIVFETMGLASIGKFRTGGTVHVVVNNQLGFTTPPVESRSSTHCSDVGRIFQCPVFHVNGDCVEDVHRVFQLAADYRATFNKSVIIDLVTYRRFGHNEGDTPHFTQPMLYKVIDKRPNVLELYTTQLAAETQNSVPAPDLAAIRAATKQKLSGAWKVIDNPENYSYADFQRSCVRDVWRPFMPSLNEAKMLPTAVTREQLEPVIRALKTLPKGFTLHKNLEKIFANRSDSLTAGNAIEWGTAEALAFGTLLQEGYPVRISGQDVERATFSQRHAVYHDQKDDSTYTQLCNIDPAQANFTVTNSSLSEYGVLGFEVGYAVRHPKNMVMWEAQFADFANGAQIMIDQYITSSETKWRLPSSVILSMPHGNDGNGPEHSSGRIERFLQANTEVDVLPEMSVVERHWRGGVEVAFPTTPKQYFHLLRRHMLRNFRKPLISFFSKSFLRAPNTSSIDELVAGEFVPLLDAKEYSVPQDKVRRVIYTCGQVYHMLAARIKKEKINDIALVRFEQLAPFPLTELKHSLASFPNAEVWFAQEEPKNVGSFSYAEPHMLRALDYSKPVNFAGRLAGPSPATGYVSIWKHEQEAIVKTALGL